MLIRSYSQCIHFKYSSECAISVDEDGNGSKWGFCNKNCAEGFFLLTQTHVGTDFKMRAKKVLFYICNIKIVSINNVICISFCGKHHDSPS